MSNSLLQAPHRVSLQKLDGYNPEDVNRALEKLLQPLGDIEAFVKPGRKVLIKPNLLAGKAPDKAVTTHPEIVRAVIERVQKAGGIVSVGDSPGIGSPESVIRKCGLDAIIEETSSRFAPFCESVKLPQPLPTFHDLEVAKDLLDADVIINLPKLKTHQMMGLTCAVKNMFGAVVGLRKPRLHLQAGTDKAFFALLLLELCEALAPALTIVDAVVGMEGEGPGSGDPVAIGVLLAGTSPLAVDAAAIELVGLNPHQVWTQQVALESNRSYAGIGELELVGDPLADLRIADFRPAKMTDVNFGLKGGLKRYLKNALTARPQVNPKACRLCHECTTHCPPQAMAITDRKLLIDHDRCIRCFCCQELCPHGALATRQGSLLKLYGLFHRQQ